MFDSESTYYVGYAVLVPSTLFDEDDTQMRATLDYLDRTMGRVSPDGEMNYELLGESVLAIEESFKDINVFGDFDGAGDVYFTNVWAGHGPDSDTAGAPLTSTFAQLTDEKRAAMDGLAEILGGTAEWTFIRNTLTF